MALDVLDDLIEAHPTEPQARIQRALTYYGFGDRDRALAELDEAIRLAPTDPVAPRLRQQITG